MAITLVKADGSTLAVVQDNTVNQDYSVGFVGTGYTGYGTIFNTDLLRLLENSAKTTEPIRSLTGQLWYNKTAPGTLNVYDGTRYKPLGYFNYASSVTNPATGELWYDTGAGQLKVYNGSGWTVLTPTPLPIASSSVLGGIKVGTGLSINSSTGVLSSSVTAYTLPIATTSVLGGVILDGTTITVNGSGVISASTSYTLPAASGSTRGGIKVGNGLQIANTDVLSVNLAGSDLPVATNSTLGAIKVGTGLNIVDGVLNNAVTAYALPIASSTILGGVKVGTGLTIDAGTGVLSSSVTAYTLPTASNTILGGIKVGDGLSISGTGVLSASGYTLPTAGVGTIGTKGGVKVDGQTITIDNGVISAAISGQVQTNWAQTTNTAVDYIKNKPAFSTVATSGSYTDLTNKPTIPAAQVNSDWTAVSGVAQILNKPALFSGSYTDLTNKPTIPAAQVNSDWNSTSGVAQILNKPTLFSGSYTDLTNKPAIPSNLTVSSGGTAISTAVTNINFAGAGVSNVTGTSTVTVTIPGVNFAIANAQQSGIGSIAFANNTLTYTPAANPLPSVTGNTGKYLTTNGTTVSWATVPSGAAQIQTDWAQTTTSATDYIKNKPTNLSQFANDTSFITAGGNTASATKLATARAIALTGDVTGTGNFDGSANLSIPATLANSGAVAGSYVNPNITVDAKGRVTSISSGSGTTTLTSFGVTNSTTPSGSGSLTYNNTNGVFTFTPPNLSGYLTSVSSTAVTNALGFTPIQRSSISVGTPNAALDGGALAYNATTGVFTFTPAQAGVTSVNGQTGAVTITVPTVTSVTGLPGSVRAWGAFAVSATPSLGTGAGGNSGYSNSGISSITFNSAATTSGQNASFTLTLSSPPPAGTRPIAIVNGVPGLAYTTATTYNAQAGGFSTATVNGVSTTVFIGSIYTYNGTAYWSPNNTLMSFIIMW